MTKGLLPLAVSVFVLVCSGCDNLPPDAYSFTSDPLPDRAKLVSQAQYSDLTKTGRFYTVTGRAVSDQEQQAQREERLNDQIIAKFQKGHPTSRKIVPDEPNEQHVIHNRNGSYSHPIRFNHGASSHVVTLGRRWAKKTIAGAIKSFGTRQNELTLYRTIYEALPERAKHDLGLPDPDTVASDRQLFPARAILELNAKITENRALIQNAQAAVREHFNSFVGPIQCSDEEGAGSGTDRFGNHDENPRCHPASTGIFQNYAWPAKNHLTCVKDQSNRGTCVSFAIASSLETNVNNATGRWVNVSEQLLYEQAKLVWFRNDFSDGLDVVSTVGLMSVGKWPLPFETAWQYNPSPSRIEDDKAQRYHHSCDGYSGNCSDSSHQGDLYCSDNGKYRYCGFLAQDRDGSGFQIGGPSELWNWIDHDAGLARVLSVLQLGQPVVWSFSVTPSWDKAGANGFVQFKGSNETNRGGHAVHVVGYIDNGTLSTLLPQAPQGAGGGYLIIKNSWSTCWGDGGFVYVPYDYVRSYTMSAAAIGGAKL